MEGESTTQASTPVGAVFLSYASQDAEAAKRICQALRAAGIEVWFDQSELRGGDAWDRQIRKQIHDCALFMPIISAHSQARLEGYFRREWKLAADRTHDMADERAFLVPIVIDDTSERSASVPDKFRDVQWTHLANGETSDAFIDRLSSLLSFDHAHGSEQPRPVPLTADGYPLKSQKPARKAGPFGRFGMPLTAAAGLIAVGYITVDRLWLPKRGTVPLQATPTSSPTGAGAQSIIPEKSIAVLPFVDLSEKHDQEYFADGMAEEVIDLLAKVPDLRVPARTSSFYFKAKLATVRDIARELSVAHVLEGSVRKSGDRIRVTAQLVRADNGYHLWSQTYDRDLKDVFKVQDEIANAVVQALQITLMGGPLTRPHGGTENLEAYQLYLRGLSASREGSRASLMVAHDFFEQAIKVDPEFGLAWVELSRDTLLLTDNGEFSTQVGHERGRQQAQRALQLSPDLAEAHALLSYVYRVSDWDWTAAEGESRRALALDPTNPTALTLAAGVPFTLGRWEEAEHLVRLALVRDPFFPLLNWWLGATQYGAGQLANAETTFRKLLEIAPEFAWARLYLAKTLVAEDKPEGAIALLMREKDEVNRLSGLPIALQAVHRDAEAEQALKALIAKYADSEAYWVAMAYAHRGDNEVALQWLDRAYRQRDASLQEIVGEHMFKRIAADPRYKAFLRKVNLPDSFPANQD